jgi:small subunit ribosomal protein S8
MRHDILSDAMSAIQNSEKIGKAECAVVGSKVVISVLEAIKKAGYIADFRQSGSEITVALAGKINALKSIRPRFAVAKDEFEKFETRFLPSREIGILVVSTSQGVMSHKEAKERGIGGRLLAFVY